MNKAFCILTKLIDLDTLLINKCKIQIFTLLRHCFRSGLTDLCFLLYQTTITTNKEEGSIPRFWRFLAHGSQF